MKCAEYFDLFLILKPVATYAHLYFCIHYLHINQIGAGDEVSTVHKRGFQRP